MKLTSSAAEAWIIGLENMQCVLVRGILMGINNVGKINESVHHHYISVYF
jgi:hypothetical protein